MPDNTPRKTGGGGGGRGPLPRPVQVSKKLSKLLRHDAEKEGLKLDSAGFVNVQDILDNRTLKSLKVSFDEVLAIVEENDKQRFAMVPLDAGGEAGEGEDAGKEQKKLKARDYKIRANQGHSLKVEADGGLLTPIVDEADVPATAVHGTTHANWMLIVASGGLKPMGRNHVHFATGLPAGFTSVGDAEAANVEVAAPVISGMRKSSTVLVWLDVRRAMAAGLKFGRSENGVVLTEGNAEGLVPLELFKRVEDRKGLGVLVEDGKVVKEAPASWAAEGGPGRPRGFGKGRGHNTLK
ncbi:KptA family-domain-containing protein [Neohortaea acidophila]|uniref:2'-phosphotransferase n=1 Tax=Neohortaea acidophila TaxID=245834 RepID=A0A6A6PWU8_9PEZI|nr:KptA family-domain-containing protein [Neohortaea acidophila]KAF2484204.1 KptA family-domain-containing protein [Neohortaea acidophila]